MASLGLADALVAVSAECDWPSDVRGLPVVTASRVDTARLSSFRIEHGVREALSDGRPLYRIDRDLLDDLRPDLILTQNLCSVCAVSANAVNELCATTARVVALDAHRLADIETRIIELATLLEVPSQGHAVVEGMRSRIDCVRRQVAGAPTTPVFVAEWIDPPYVSGHWLPEMVSLAGGRDVLGRPGAAAYATTWDVVQSHHPQLVILAPCGFDHERAAREAATLRLGCRTIAVDGNAYYARPAPRIADGVAQLAFLIHPDRADDPGLPHIELAAA